MVHPSKAESLQSMQERKDFKHRKITPLHPEANGEAERFVKTLQKFISQQWKVTVGGCRCLIFYECTDQCPTVTGRSPSSQLFGGREMRGKIPQFNFNSKEDPKMRQKDA